MASPDLVSSDDSIVVAQPQSPSDSGDHANDANTKLRRCAWKVPVNGAASVAVEVAVMGANSWPALSESTRPSPKSSVNSPKETEIPLCESEMKTNSNNTSKSGMNQNHGSPARQKSMKWGGSGSGAPSPALTEMRQVIRDKQPVLEEQQQKESSGDSHIKSGGSLDHEIKSGGSIQNHGGGSEQHRGYGYGGGRRSNGGNGYHNNNYYGNHNRGNFEWSHHRSFNGRDAQNGHHQVRGGGQRPFVRPVFPLGPAAPPPFIGPPLPVQPFGNPMGFPDMPSHMYYVPSPESHFEMFGAVPCVPPGTSHAMFSAPPQDPVLSSKLIKQIEYYFSTENLCRDIYLRKNMDDQGWVPISLIAGFNRVKQLTNSEQYILDTLSFSTLLEVQGGKVRRRADWMDWILPQSSNYDSSSGSQSPSTPNLGALSSHFQRIGFEGNVNSNELPGAISWSSSGNHMESVHSVRSLVRSDTF